MDRIISVKKIEKDKGSTCEYCGKIAEGIATFKDLSEWKVCLDCARNKGKWKKNRRLGLLSKNKPVSVKNSLDLHREESQTTLLDNKSASKSAEIQLEKNGNEISPVSSYQTGGDQQ